MTVNTVRNIVKIDEEKCNGCGACVPACAEGALQIIDGKAKIISEIYCDGLGACLGECPQGAITIEQRTAPEFNEEATKIHLKEQENAVETPSFSGCPSSVAIQFEKKGTASLSEVIEQPSMLSHWPVQLTLVPPAAPFLQGTDLVLAADCVPFAYAGFHQDFLKDHTLLVACPKLDDFQAHLQKLTEVLKQSSIKSLTIVHMEVPCCFGLMQLVKQAVQRSGKDIPVKDVTVGIKGDLIAA